jgi:nitrate reductase NapD
VLEGQAHIISSAIVSVMPGTEDHVASGLAVLPDTEVGPIGGGRIVIVLEGRTRGEVGARLAQIALMDGVVAANLVFEHIEEDKGHSP